MKATTYLGILFSSSAIGGLIIGTIDSPWKWLGLIPVMYAGWESNKFKYKGGGKRGRC